MHRTPRARSSRCVRLSLEVLEGRCLPSGFQPTAVEQLFLEELNDARANPAAYGASIGVDLSYIAPSQPLAFSPLLVQAARLHSQDMNANAYFGHVSPSGQDPGQRISATGFSWTSWGESIAAGGSYADPAQALAGLIIDAGVPDLGHRHQLLAYDPMFQNQLQAGVGVVLGGTGPYQNYYTIDTAASTDGRPFLTGVVYYDTNHNGRYDIGEGLGGVTVAVAGVGSIATWGSGGYSLQLNPGTYTVTFSGPGLAAPFVRVVSLAQSNVRVSINAAVPTGPAYYTVTTANGLSRYTQQGGWTQVGGNGTILSISTTVDATGTTVVFAITADHSLFRFDGRTWLRLGNSGSTQHVSAGTDASGQADVFTLTGDGSFCEFNSQWGWVKLGNPGSVTQMSAAGGGRAYVVTADQSVFQFDNQLGWARLTSSGYAQSVSAVTDLTGTPTVYAVTTSHGLTRYTPAAGWVTFGGNGTIAAAQAGINAFGQAEVAVITTGGVFGEFNASGWLTLGAAGSILSFAPPLPGAFYVVTASNQLVEWSDTSGWSSLTNTGFAHSYP